MRKYPNVTVEAEFDEETWKVTISFDRLVGDRLYSEAPAIVTRDGEPVAHVVWRAHSNDPVFGGKLGGDMVMVRGEPRPAIHRKVTAKSLERLTYLVRASVTS